MSITVYGIANCDTCRKARKWLTDRNIEHVFHDVRAEGLDQQVIRGWGKRIAPADLINQRSRTWREMTDVARRQVETHPSSLLAERPLLLKRPLLETPDGLLQGFSETDWAALLGIQA